MAVELEGTVHEGQKYTVRLTNNSKAGAELLLVGWVPKQAHGVPGPQSVSVAPSAPPIEIMGVVPKFADARLMTIVASLEAGQSAQLELLENGVSVASEGISETTTWQLVVDTVGS